jgi:hypothetical protein
MPVPKSTARVITKAITCYIWKYEIFKVPLLTLQRKESEGGQNMIYVERKAKTLYLIRYSQQSKKEGISTAA